jgi:hypothetical protein
MLVVAGDEMGEPVFERLLLPFATDDDGTGDESVACESRLTPEADMKSLAACFPCVMVFVR